jgi:hypothetical protein
LLGLGVWYVWWPWGRTHTPKKAKQDIVRPVICVILHLPACVSQNWNRGLAWLAWTSLILIYHLQPPMRSHLSPPERAMLIQPSSGPVPAQAKAATNADLSYFE